MFSAKALMLSTASLGMMPTAALAQAQPSPSAVANEGRTDAQPSAPGTPASSAGNAVGPAAPATDGGEIIVTAQRRSERLVDVPIAVSAITAERMSSAGVVSTTDLASVTPGLSFPTQGAFAQPVVRGVGTSLTGPGADPAVAIYLDGVYQPNQAANNFDFNSVEQIEVLKGPQGTLFGRNATGGAIVIRTLNPSFVTDVRTTVSYARFNDIKLNFYGNLPIVDDVLAVNLAVAYRNEDSFTYNLATNRNIDGLRQYAFRPKILLQPASNVSLVLIGSHSKVTNPRVQAFAPRNGNNVENLNNPALPVPTRRFQVSLNEEPSFLVIASSLSLKSEIDFDFGTFSTISAYSSVKNVVSNDGDNSAAPTTTSIRQDRQKTFSQELNFASAKFGAVSFIAGLFYYHDDANRVVDMRARSTGPVTRRTASGIETHAYAAYSEINFDVTDTLHLIGGIRYSREKKRASGLQTISAPGSLNAEKTFDGWTPRAAIRYELSPSANVYASYSKGFKSGIFNATALSPIPVEQESVSAYEVGFKFSRDGFRFNTSAYYYDYAGIQVQSSIATNVFILQNAASAEIYGADAEFSAPITDSFRLEGGLAYTHGRYTDFKGALLVERLPNGRNRQYSGDASGNPTVRTPAFTANGTASFEHEVGFGKFQASVTGSYNSGFYWQQDMRIREPAYFLLAGEIGFSIADDMLRLTLWGRNLLDEDYANYQAQSANGDNIVYDRPRTIGVTMATRF